jgi:elongation factor 1-beta
VVLKVLKEVNIMGDVISVLKIYPKDVTEDLTPLVNTIRSRLPERYRLLRYEEEDLAYGYKILRLFIVFPEMTEGGTEELENIIRSIDEVDEVEVELVTRVF